MDEKILKQLKTTCPFPLLIYKTSVKYNEVRKASGIAYILLDLIQKENESNDKISDVLLKFGIPTNLHYIFGQEIANLMSIDILSSHFDPSYFAKPTYFKQIIIGDVELTLKGKKMFQDGAIPTGAEKVKVKDIYYSPVTRKFDVESKVPYMTLGSSFLGDDFMDHVNVDISGMEDYINANGTKIGLKAEERVVSFECEEPQKMHTRKEEGMTIIIRPSGVEFKFDTTDENAFFNKYYTSRLMTDGLLAKNKYKFVNEKKDIVEVPTVSINELTNITNVYIPDDAQKQASRPCKFFFSKNRLGVKGVDTSMKLGVDDSTILLNDLNLNAEFALLDKSCLKFYSPLNVSMPCEQLGDTFEMQLLVERTADEDVLKNILLKLYDIYHNETFSAEIGKAILFIVESLKDSSYFEKYSTNQLSKYNSVDEQIDLLLKMNSSFKGNSDWNEYFKTIGSNLVTNSIKEIRLDNMIYKNTVLTPLKNELKIVAHDYIKMFSEPVLSEDQDLVYQALETAGFETNQILGVVNVVETYMDKILNDESISADTSLADKFRTVSSNLWNLNDMLGIESYSEYTLNEDFNVDEFFNAYSTLKTATKSIEKYSKFAQDKYNNMNKYLEIYEPIHELLAIEREASSHPDKITKKYIDDYISKGRFKNAICELSVKLQYDLRELLKADDKTEAFELINMAEQEKLIDSKKCSSLHKFRKIRNGFQHPEKEQIQYTKADIEEWIDIVFEIGGSK